MADKPDPKDPSNVSAAWAKMFPKWKLIQTLLDGTEAMRGAGTEYLPQHDSESPNAYNERLTRNTLYNVTKITLQALVGRPFATTIGTENVPSEIATLLPNIDLQGSDLHTFARAWFRTGLSKCFCHVLVEMNGAVDDGTGRVRTMQDDLRNNVRPFWKLITPECLIAAYAEVGSDGVERLVHARIKETETIRVGFLETTKEFIRVLEPGTWTLYEKREEARTKKIVWMQVGAGVTGLDFIPLVTFYANREGLMEGTPPLEDLAHLNVRHWQSTSDQINVLTVARFPMLAVAGAHEINSDTMAIGPRQLLGTRDANGRFYYVEHTGKAIEAGERDLEALEEIMGNFGAEFLKKKKAASRNPQDRIYDVTESTSELQEIILFFMASMAQALSFTAAWLKLPLKDEKLFGGTVVLDNNFTIQDSNANDLQHLAQARKNGDISLQTYIDTLKRLNVIDDSVVTEEEINRIVEERLKTAQFEAQKQGMLTKAITDNSPPPPKPAAGTPPQA